MRFLADKAGFSYDTGNIDDDGTEVPIELRYTRMAKCLATAAADPEVKTIIVDSLTTVRDYVKFDILRQRGQNPNVKNAVRFDPSHPQFAALVLQEWDTFAFYFRHLIANLRTTNKIIVFTAHQEVKAGEDDGVFRTFLAMPGQSRHNISALFSDVWNTYVEQVGFGSSAVHNRMVRTLPTGATDDRGLKDSLGLPAVSKVEDVIKHINQIYK